MESYILKYNWVITGFEPILFLFWKKTGSESGSDKQQTIKQHLNKEISLNIKKV